MKDSNQESSVEVENEDEQSGPISESRRKAVTKMAYASPVLAGLLFTHSSTAQAMSPDTPIE